MNKNNLTGINKFSSDLSKKADLSYVTNELSKKANINNAVFTGTTSGITKSMINLGNVNNTSDENKPLSNAMIDALNNKVDKDDNEIDGVGNFESIIGDAINGFFTIVTTVTVWGSIQSQIAGLQAQISALGSTIANVQGSISALWTALNLVKLDVEILQAKTFFQSVFGNATKFSSDVIITDNFTNTIELLNDGSILCVGDINTLSNLQCKECICENKLTTDDLQVNNIISTNFIQALTQNDNLHINSFINQF